MKYTVYLRTNLVNGMKYVGQTKSFIGRESDWKDLSTRYANKLITKDREEFGLENFDTDVLAEVDTQDEAWELEKKFIKELDTKFPNGYNMGDGGKDPSGTKHTDESRENMSQAHIGNYLSEETKLKMSKIHKGQIPWNKGKKNCFSDETIKKLSERMSGENHPFYGKHHSEETKRKIGEHSKGKTSPMKGKHFTEDSKRKLSEAKKGKPNIALSMKVYQYKNGILVGEYSSVAEAARKTGFVQSEISTNCRGGRFKNGKWIISKTYKGYKWSYKPL